MTGPSEAELQQALRQHAAHTADLERQHDEIVAASRDSNADEEHDPEGATIAFERQQVDALVRQAEQRLADIDAAVARVADTSYGTCEQCGRPIPPERLAARPSARSCVSCARGTSRR